MPFRATNRTRGKVLGDKVREARGFSERFVGLMGTRELPIGDGLHIVPCNSIHTFFMRIPIDVLFLDVEGKVIRAIQALPPWRATSVYFRAKTVLELPAGVLSASGTEEGDVIEFEEVVRSPG